MKRIREYSDTLGMADAFMDICYKKSVQNDHPSDVVRIMAGDTVFVVCQPDIFDPTQLYRYSISTDTWDHMDIDLLDTFDSRIHCINGHIYILSNGLDSTEVRVSIESSSIDFGWTISHDLNGAPWYLSCHVPNVRVSSDKKSTKP